MIYGGVISTPANTAASSPLRTKVSVTAGLLYHAKIVFPPGPSGLLHVQVFDGSYQLFPTTLGQSFVGDNLLLQFDELYFKEIEPYFLDVLTWNLDDTYAHEVQVMLSLASREEYIARYLPGMQTDALVQAMAAQEAVKEKVRRDRVAAFVETLPTEGG